MNGLSRPLTPLLTPRGFQELMEVSDGVLERLEAYVALLRKWQQKVNLVASRDDNSLLPGGKLTRAENQCSQGSRRRVDGKTFVIRESYV